MIFYIYIWLHCYHQNDFCIKVGSDDHNFWREKRAEADSNRGPSAYQPNALPLGQTGSHSAVITDTSLIAVCLYLVALK